LSSPSRHPSGLGERGVSRLFAGDNMLVLFQSALAGGGLQQGLGPNETAGRPGCRPCLTLAHFRAVGSMARTVPWIKRRCAGLAWGWSGWIEYPRLG